MIKLFKQLWPYIQKHKITLIAAMLCAIPLGMIKGYQTYLVKPIFDHGLSPDSDNGKAVELALKLIALGLLNYPFRFFHFYGMKMTANRVVYQLRNDLYKKIQLLPVSYFAKNKTGNMISKIMNDTHLLTESFNRALDVVREPITAVVLLCVALYHDYQLTLMILIVFPLFGLIFKFSGKAIKRYTEKLQHDLSEMTHDLTEGIVGQKIIKAFNIKDFIFLRFKKSQDSYLKVVQKFVRTEEHAHPIIETIGAVMFASIIMLAHYRITKGHLTTGGFVSFIAAIAMLMDPVRKYSAANMRLNSALAAAARVFSILDEKQEIDEGTTVLEEFKESIEFKNITFSYGEGNVIENFSLKINKGEKAAFVGLSGSGKSTLISLLLRLYDIENGEILIDGINIKKYTLESLRSQLALVSQDIFLFNDTVKENLLVGKERSKQEIDHAVEISYSKEFIDGLENGIETIIGDRGLKLSGGQCQRLTIARAFLSHSPILLFDEATSALDNESEKTVQAAMEQVSGSRTVIAVAHRLSTIQNYDKIVVMKDGKKIEEGNHQELIDLGGEYKKLYELSLG